MFVQIDQALCAGCGACIEVCSVGAISLVNRRAEIDYDLCTTCEACVDACPSGAIFTVIAPVYSEPLVVQSEEEKHVQPVQEQAALPEVTSPARGLIPLAGAAMSFLGHEVAPRLADVLARTLEQKIASPTTTRISSSSTDASPLSTSSGNTPTPHRGQQKQSRYRGGGSGRGGGRGRR